MNAFRQLATPMSGDDVIITAALELKVDGTTDGSVQVWSIPHQTPHTEFDTILDFGGRRLALCSGPDRLVVVAGAWERHGICGYDARTGERLWQRQDLKQVQALSPVDGDAVAACFDTRPMHVLDAASGATVATVRGVRRFWQSRHRAVGAAEVMGHVALVGTDDWRVRWRAPVAGFALLDAAFAPAAVLVSDAVDFTVDAGAVCSLDCFSLTGELLWQRRTARETNVPWLGWDAEAAEWLGITHHVENREPEMLSRWSRDGELLSRVALGLVGEYAFLPAGKLLVTGHGDLVETRAASQVGRLPRT
ncbi:MAG: hypothetical protein ACT4OQ_10100 [Chloroflexota bacterium]